VPNGSAGRTFLHARGLDGISGTGVGGGLNRLSGSTVNINDTNIRGNNASTTGDDLYAMPET
jgi:hypothetical protein